MFFFTYKVPSPSIKTLTPKKKSISNVSAFSLTEGKTCMFSSSSSSIKSEIFILLYSTYVFKSSPLNRVALKTWERENSLVLLLIFLNTLDCIHARYITGTSIRGSLIKNFESKQIFYREHVVRVVECVYVE